MRGLSPIVATLVIVAVTIVIASVVAFTLTRISREVEPRGSVVKVQSARGVIANQYGTSALLYLTMYVHGTTPVVILSSPQVSRTNESQYTCVTYGLPEVNATVYPNQVIEVTISCRGFDSNRFMPYEIVYVSMKYADVARNFVSELYVPVMIEPYYR